MVNLLQKLLKKLVNKSTMRRAVLIGIDQYPPGNELSGCVNDITSLKDVIELNEDGTENFKVVLMPNVSSKNEAMLEIKALFSGAGDMSLLYFSGHGYVNDTDAELAFPDGIHNNDYYKGIKMSDIMNIVHKSKVKNKIIILDCCHSGSLGKFHINHDESLIGEGVSVLCACKDSEFAMESNGQGMFTVQLCNALKGGAADYCGNITIGGIYAFIDRVFGPKQQRPTFKTNVTEFSPVRRVIPKVPVSIIRLLPSLFPNMNDEFKLDPSYEESNIAGNENSIMPYASPVNTSTFKSLQKLESIGFVEPTDEEHMYYAAMKNKSCHLTQIGKYYWNLAKTNQI